MSDSPKPPKRYIHIPGKDLERITKQLDAGAPKRQAAKTRWQVFLETVFEAGGSPLERTFRLGLIALGAILALIQVIEAFR